MPEYTRRFVEGGLFFFTLVTDGRRPIFADPAAVTMFGEAMREARERLSFGVEALVLLHDHLHTIWKLPRGDARFDKRWSKVKRNFTERFLDAGGEELAVSDGRRRERRRGVWQPRYHEHLIRDEEDHRRHVTYLHLNPVRHGLAATPEDWAASSIHRYIRNGWLRPGWGTRPGDAGEPPEPGFSFGEPGEPATRP